MPTLFEHALERELTWVDLVFWYEANPTHLAAIELAEVVVAWRDGERRDGAYVQRVVRAAVKAMRS